MEKIVEIDLDSVQELVPNSIQNSKGESNYSKTQNYQNSTLKNNLNKKAHQASAKNQSNSQLEYKHLESTPTFQYFIVDPSITSRQNQQYETQERVFINVTLGHAFIEGFKIFKKHNKTQTLILSKQFGYSSIYLYIKFIPTFNNQEIKTAVAQLTEAITIIDNFREEPQKVMKILICGFKECCHLPMSKQEFGQLIKGQLDVTKSLVNMMEEQNSEKDDLTFYQQRQFQNLKMIINNYIDTFGTKHKGNIYSEIQKYSPPGLKVRIILNTLAFLLYQESYNKPFTQIESSSWTAFNRRAKRNTIDRKDIVLTGKGRLLMLDLVFLRELDQYINKNDPSIANNNTNQTYSLLSGNLNINERPVNSLSDFTSYNNEVKEVIDECKKFYQQVIIKAVRITNLVHSSKLIYKIEIREINKHSEIERIEIGIQSIRKMRKKQ